MGAGQWREFNKTLDLFPNFDEGIDTWSLSSALNTIVSRFSCAWLTDADMQWRLHQLR